MKYKLLIKSYHEYNTDKSYTFFLNKMETIV